MAVTANLGITLIDAAQAQKEVTANGATVALDNAVAGRSAISIAGAAGTQTLTAAQVQPMILEFTGAITGNRAIEVPATAKHWIVFNNTSGAFTVTMRVVGQTGIVVATAKRAILYTDGTDVRRVTADT